MGALSHRIQPVDYIIYCFPVVRLSPPFFSLLDFYCVPCAVCKVGRSGRMIFSSAPLVYTWYQVLFAFNRAHPPSYCPKKQVHTYAARGEPAKTSTAVVCSSQDRGCCTFFWFKLSEWLVHTWYLGNKSIFQEYFNCQVCFGNIVFRGTIVDRTKYCQQK